VAQHPIVTAIIYLSPAPEGQEDVAIGGPTIVTDQTLQSEHLASEGFMFLPRQNRMIAFDARYLHGESKCEPCVVPINRYMHTHPTRHSITCGRSSLPEALSFCGVVWCGVVWCGVVWCGVM
jgi:hypothetical protein